MPDSPENIVTAPAELFIAPSGEPFEAWTSIGFTDGGIQFTPLDPESTSRAALAYIQQHYLQRYVAQSVLAGADLSDLLLRRPKPLPEETEGRDTTPCAGSGGRWSDLMARIGDLVDE